MKPSGPKKIVPAESNEIATRKREIQLIFNIIEPDPEFQPIFTSDEATLLDSTAHDREMVRARLEAYLHFDCGHLLNMPIWEVVDEIRARIPGWPDEPNASGH